MYNVNSIIYNEFNKRYSNVNNNIHTYFVSIFEKLTQYVNIRIKYPIKEKKNTFVRQIIQDEGCRKSPIESDYPLQLPLTQGES